MLIPARELYTDHSVRPNGVLHLGAHHGEEAADYDEWGWGPVWWVEANPKAFTALQARLNGRRRLDRPHTAINALVGAEDGVEVVLNIASNGQSSSVLPLGTHLVEHPEVTYTGEVVTAETITVDTLMERWLIKADFVNLDLQGYELEALKGAGEFLRHARWVYTEVNKDELYLGCPHIVDIDDFLLEHGFRRDVTRWTRHGWGDALYRKAR